MAKFEYPGDSHSLNVFSMPSVKIKSLLNKLRPFFAVNKNRYAFIFVLALIILVVPSVAHADAVSDALATTLATIFLWVAGLLGKLLLVVINILLVVVQYNDFVNASAVAKGWYIVRDLCNMFFVVVLLVIAFGTILKWDKYRYEKLLPNLLIMAVLVNFSKVICGFFIDFGQVVMLTFVNAFKDAAGGNFTSMFGLQQMLSYRESVTAAPQGWEYVGAGILAVALILIAIVVMVALVVVFLVRIVMLWILVVLSPLAYLLSTMPGTASSRASQWWSQFGKWVTIGPILAFFVWLSLTIAAAPSSSGESMSQSMGFNKASTKEQAAVVGNEGIGTDTLAASISSISSSDNLLSFAIAIAMLVMALMTAQQMGGVAGGFAGKALGKIQGAGTAVLKAPKKALGAAGGAIARTGPVRNLLGATGGATGVGGAILAATGVRALATKASVATAQAAKKKQDAKAAYVGSISDVRILGRMANSRLDTAQRRAARDKAPSTIRDRRPGDHTAENHINRMSDESLRKVSDAEWAAVGRNGINLTGRAETIVRRDRDALGAYNAARVAAGVGPALEMFDVNNNPIAGVTGTPVIAGTPYGDRILRQGDNRNRYRLAQTGQGQGQGDLAVNEFGSGESNVAAVDFSKLDPEVQKNLLEEAQEENPAIKGMKDIKGVDITGDEKIHRVAASMSKVIEDEIGKLRASGGKQSEIEKLEAARDRFSRGDMSNISMVNSSSSGYTYPEFERTVLHEDMHGSGITDEEQAEGGAEYLKQNRLASQDTRRAIARAAATSGRSIEDVINDVEVDEVTAKLESSPDALKKSLDAYDRVTKQPGMGKEEYDFVHRNEIAQGLMYSSADVENMKKAQAEGRDLSTVLTKGRRAAVKKAFGKPQPEEIKRPPNYPEDQLSDKAISMTQLNALGAAHTVKTAAKDLGQSAAIGASMTKDAAAKAGQAAWGVIAKTPSAAYQASGVKDFAESMAIGKEMTKEQLQAYKQKVDGWLSQRRQKRARSFTDTMQENDLSGAKKNLEYARDAEAVEQKKYDSLESQERSMQNKIYNYNNEAKQAAKTGDTAKARQAQEAARQQEQVLKAKRQEKEAQKNVLGRTQANRLNAEQDLSQVIVSNVESSEKRQAQFKKLSDTDLDKAIKDADDEVTDHIVNTVKSIGVGEESEAIFSREQAEKARGWKKVLEDEKTRRAAPPPPPTPTPKKQAPKQKTAPKTEPVTPTPSSEAAPETATKQAEAEPNTAMPTPTFSEPTSSTGAGAKYESETAPSNKEIVENYERSTKGEMPANVKNIVYNIIHTTPLIEGHANNEMVDLLRRLLKATEGQHGALDRISKSLGNLSSFNPNTATPLEISMITEQIKKDAAESGLGSSAPSSAGPASPSDMPIE